jgi:hypothetical protein
LGSEWWPEDFELEEEEDFESNEGNTDAGIGGGDDHEDDEL